MVDKKLDNLKDTEEILSEMEESNDGVDTEPEEDEDDEESDDDSNDSDEVITPNKQM